MSVQLDEKRADMNTHNHCMTGHCHIHYVHVKLGYIGPWEHIDA